MMSTLTPATLTYRQGDALPALRVTPGAGSCSETFDAAAYEDWTFTLVGPVTLTLAGTLEDDGTVTAALAADTLDVPGEYLVTLAATAVTGGAARTWPSSGGTVLTVEPVLT